jgi:hypothetical protein
LLASLRPFVLANVLAEQGAYDEAAAVAARLIETGQAMRLPMSEGRGRWVLSEVFRRRGDFVTGARAAISTARDRILANAEKIGDANYKRSFLEKVPENVRTLALARQWLGE